MNDLRRLHFVTANYQQLQGLRLIPLAIPFLLSAAWRNGRLTWVPGTGGRGSVYWFALLMLLAVIGASLVGGYYRSHFGHVRPARSLRAPVAVAAFAALFLFTVWTQQTYHWPISVPTLLVGCAVGYIGLKSGQTRPHYLALSGLCCIFATLRSLGVPFTVRDVLLDDLVGIGLIVIGIGDHLLLRRTLEPVSHVEAV